MESLSGQPIVAVEPRNSILQVEPPVIQMTLGIGLVSPIPSVENTSEDLLYNTLVVQNDPAVESRTGAVPGAEVRYFS